MFVNLSEPNYPVSKNSSTGNEHVESSKLTSSNKWKDQSQENTEQRIGTGVSTRKFSVLCLHYGHTNDAFEKNSFTSTAIEKFEELEIELNENLAVMSKYYKDWMLKPNIVIKTKLKSCVNIVQKLVESTQAMVM